MGKTNSSLYTTAWPLSNKKYEKLKETEESFPWMLAKSLSLRRQQGRDKEVHRRSRNARYDEHRMSQDMDALFFLYGPDWFRSRDFCMGEGDLLCKEACEGSWMGDFPSMNASKGNTDPKDRLQKKPISKFHEDRRYQRFNSSNGLLVKEKLAFECVSGEKKRITKGNVPKAMKDKRDTKFDATNSVSACLPCELSSISVKECIPFVKHSCNPYKDFRDSLMEMIMGSNVVVCNADLEELLFSYLSLNSPEHYDSIREAFMDIWIELMAA